jgi:hypothetical protein
MNTARLCKRSAALARLEKIMEHHFFKFRGRPLPKSSACAAKNRPSLTARRRFVTIRHDFFDLTAGLPDLVALLLARGHCTAM